MPTTTDIALSGPPALQPARRVLEFVTAPSRTRPARCSRETNSTELE